MCWREGYSNKIFYEFKRIQKNVSKCQKYSCKMMSFLVKQSCEILGARIIIH